MKCEHKHTEPITWNEDGTTFNGRICQECKRWGEDIQESEDENMKKKQKSTSTATQKEIAKKEADKNARVSKLMKTAGKQLEDSGLGEAMSKAAEEIRKEIAVKKEKRALMTIAETKLGITMVLSKEECETIGLASTMTTRDAIKELKQRLGVNA